MLVAGEHELESFLNYDALPRASLGVLRVALGFRSREARVGLLIGKATPLVEVRLRGSEPESTPRIEVVDLRLASIPAPAFLRSGLSRVLNDSLAAGDLGVIPLSLAFKQGEAQLVLTRR